LQWPLEGESENEDETHKGQQVRTGGTETQRCAGASGWLSSLCLGSSGPGVGPLRRSMGYARTTREP
jgi:hypothetical protein